MKGFLKSGRAGADKPHYHLIYIDPVSKTPMVCVEEDHTHEVLEAEDGSFSLAPAIDGHVHEGYEQFIPRQKKTKDDEDKETKVQRVYSLFQAAYENEGEALKDGDECDRFYAGDQWEDKVRRELESQNRACLTNNFTEKYIDDMTGYQRQARTDLRFLPIEGSDQSVVDILNVLWKVVAEKSSFEQEESAVFEDQIITGRGVFNFYLDMMSDYRGDIKIECFPRDQVVFGPHSKVDGSDADYVVKYQWWSMGNLKARYPHLAEELDSAWKEATGSPGGVHVQHTVDLYLKSENKIPNAQIPGTVLGETLIVDIARKEMRVFELQEKLRHLATVLVNEEGNDFVNAYGWSKKDIKQAESLRDQTGKQIFEVIEKIPVQKIRIIRACGPVLLVDENPADLAVDDFHVVPVYGKKRKNNFWGKGKAAKDPQRELNKRISQSMDVANKTAGHGYYYDEGTFQTEKQIQEFKSNVSKAGFVQKVANVLNRPVKEEGTKFPSEFVGLADMSRGTLKELMSISPSSHAGANTSGAAMMQAEKAGLVGIEKFFDNLSFSKRKLGLLFIGNVKKYYSADRIYRIIANQHSKTPVKLGGVPFDQLKYESIIELIETNDLSKCDVAIGEANWSPTARLATLSIFTELASKGQYVPIQIIGKLLDAPEDLKQELIQTVLQQEQSQAASAGAAGEREVQKALIGQGLFPPKVLQEQGLAPPDPAQQQEAPQPEGGPGPYEQGAAGLI